MNDYILREDALNAFDGELEITGTKNKNAVMKFLQRGFHNIRKLPAADVVEVVRCKDCKFFMNNTDFGYPWCDKQRHGNLFVSGLDYCSKAERKDK